MFFYQRCISLYTVCCMNLLSWPKVIKYIRVVKSRDFLENFLMFCFKTCELT